MASSIASRSTAALLVIALGSPGLARADEPTPSDKTMAQSLFDQGRALMDQERYAEACPRFADSERLDPGGGTVLNLALCYEKSGKLALAHGTYGEAMSLAIAEHRRERETFARDRMAALAPRLPHVTLVVSNASSTTEVRLDGTRVPSSAWGTPMAIDPGEHTVEASAPDRLQWHQAFSVTERDSRAVPIDLVASATIAILAPVVAPEPAPSAPPPALLSPMLPVPPLRPMHMQSRRLPAFWVLGGIGLASIGVSIGTGFIALAAHNDASKKCSSETGFCTDPSGISDASRARTFAWVSTGTLAGGLLFDFIAISLPVERKLIVGSAPGGATIGFQTRFQ